MAALLASRGLGRVASSSTVLASFGLGLGVPVTPPPPPVVDDDRRIIVVDDRLDTVPFHPDLVVLDFGFVDTERDTVLVVAREIPLRVLPGVEIRSTTPQPVRGSTKATAPVRTRRGSTPERRSETPAARAVPQQDQRATNPQHPRPQPRDTRPLPSE